MTQSYSFWAALLSKPFSFAKRFLAGPPTQAVCTPVFAPIFAAVLFFGAQDSALATNEKSGIIPSFPLQFEMTPQQLHDRTFRQLDTEKERVQNSTYNIQRLSGMVPKGRNLLNRTEVNLLFEETKNHSVVGISEKTKNIYDPDYNIGFCFGRAEYVYRRALQMGASPDSVVKIFVFGPLNSLVPEIKWNFHVATMIYTKEAGWVAIDTGLFLPHAVRIADWVFHVNKYIAQKNWLLRPRALDFVPSTPERIFPDEQTRTNVSLYRDHEIQKFRNWEKVKYSKDGEYYFRTMTYLRNMYQSLQSNEKVFKCEMAFFTKP